MIAFDQIKSNNSQNEEIKNINEIYCATHYTLIKIHGHQNFVYYL